MTLKELQEIARGIIEAKGDNDFIIKEFVATTTVTDDAKTGRQVLGNDRYSVSCRDTGIVDQDDFKVYEAENNNLFIIDVISDGLIIFDIPTFWSTYT